MPKKIKILFVCTGNSCRSQMAEGWAKRLKGDLIESSSVGISCAGLNQRAIQVMAEAGVDISNQTSKHIDDLADIDFDYVITVCDNAKEQCPVLSSKIKTIHKSFDDPASVTGDAEHILSEFRRVRDEIKTFVETMPKSLSS